MKSEPDEQLSLTDPDARSMISEAKGTGVVGYNVQPAVDAKHHLIVAHEVTNIGSDRSQLSKMAVAAREAMGERKLKALADRGYFNGPEIKVCEEAGIMLLVPKPMTSNAWAAGSFSKANFIFIARDDEYRCPAGQPPRRHYTSVENGLRIQTYWTCIYPQCPLKAQCTTGNERRVRRSEHKTVVEATQRRLDRMHEAMTRRRSTIEHVFGTLRHWMSSTHFLTRTLSRGSAEMSLHVLAYNLKRVMSILGIGKTMKVMKLMGA